MNQVGQCPECTVRENDCSEKRLYKCKFCGRRFCHRHLKPRLVEIPALRYASQDVEWQRLVKMSDRKKSHPDFQFTKQRINELVTIEERRRKAIIRLLDGWAPSVYEEIDLPQSNKARRNCPKCGSEKIEPSEKALHFVCLNCGNKWKLGEWPRVEASIPEPKPSDTMKTARKKSPPKLKTCPRCGSERTMTTAYREQFDAFECLDCNHQWKHFHGMFEERPKRKKKALKREGVTETAIGLLIGCVIALAGIGIIVWEIYNQMFWTIIFVWFIPVPLVLIGIGILIFGVIVAVGSVAAFVGSLPPLKKVIAILLVVIILGIVLWNAPSIFSTFQRLTGFQPSSTYSHEELVTYALSLINSDRTEHGVSNVSLSSVDSAQKHADNMLKYHFFSHWDTNGYKPYMRYTLSGGEGSVAENVAWQYSSGALDVKETLKSLEWEMMYNDADWDWGHRDNILNPFHNKVSIGIAYDNRDIYFVQDFENDYISWSTLSIAQNGEVLISGSFGSRELSVESVNIFYDPSPSNLTSDQLAKAPFNGGYDAGTFVGMTLPSGWESVEGITITAQTWVQTSTTFQIRFNLSPAFNAHGKGVYTLYLQPDLQVAEDSLTTYSFWYE